MANNRAVCALCGQECDHHVDGQAIHYYDCPSCGSFAATHHAVDLVLPQLEERKRRQLAACCRERTIHGLPELCLFIRKPAEDTRPGDTSIEYVLQSIFPSRIQDRFDRVLRNLCAMTSFPGERLSLHMTDDLPVLFAESEEAGNFMLQELTKLGYITHGVGGVGPPGYLHALVYAAGIERVQQLERASGREASLQAFVAMWFDPQTDGAYYHGIEPAVKACGFNPRRIDIKEHNNKICDEIIAEIRRSRFLIADCTGQRPGVYYEAGFAQGLGITVIWTCCKRDVRKLHFDTRQYSHVVWDGPDDLCAKLTNRIRATIPGAE